MKKIDNSHHPYLLIAADLNPDDDAMHTINHGMFNESTYIDRGQGMYTSCLIISH